MSKSICGGDINDGPGPIPTEHPPLNLTAPGMGLCPRFLVMVREIPTMVTAKPTGRGICSSDFTRGHPRSRPRSLTCSGTPAQNGDRPAGLSSALVTPSVNRHGLACPGHLAPLWVPHPSLPGAWRTRERNWAMHPEAKEQILDF